jgi:hypothetical protein
MAKTTRNQWLTPDSETGDDICRPLSIPPAFLTTVSGLLETLTEQWRWEDFGDISPADCVVAMRTMLDTFYQGCDVRFTPSRFNLSWPEGVNASGGAGAAGWVGIATCENGGVWRISPASIGDTITWKQPMRAGTYTAIFHTIRRTNGGIVQLKLDGSNKGSLDTYGTTLDNWVASLGTFTIADDGVHQITLEVTGKNAASSSYFMYFDRLYLFQLASS